ncbi:MAG: ATP-binding protein [Candidatus Aenigmarchaeota archaeon]|nr:ATP-binding protein [Candidatus Aenigmarchaeota archaeon]
MTTWYDVVEPHQDIKDGNFDESVFAAKLGDVARGQAPPDYGDPQIFFRKTYLTAGLNDILLMVYDKLSSGKGSAVVEIKTPFGGGKTHALISIYHYLKSGEKIKDELPKGIKPINAGVAVIVGTDLNPAEGNIRDGITIHTLWGEIAYQLGGKEGYQFFHKNDTDKIAPGKEKLAEFLEQQQPFIILCDEVLEYVTKARGVEYHGTNLGSQTYAFFQELTETVSSLKNGMMIVTLPSSSIEDYGERTEESLAKLEKIFGRIESIETPVKGEEIYSIIQRRLFSDIKNSHKKDKIVLDYFELYQKHKDELPAKVRDADYKRKMELAYPFHPEVIDILNEKWSTYSSFQKTRGVLRLLANVIEDLYNSEKNIDIILPSDINLNNPSIRQEFLKHIGNEYEGIISSDIAGHDAKSISLDKENKGWKHLAERISTAIFFYSFSVGRSEKGITLEYLKLSVMHKDSIPSMITEVLQRLDKTLWYLNEKGGMYHFSKIPNLNRMILDKKELYNVLYKEEMKNILKNEVGNAFISFLWPTKSEDIPDNKEIKLVILKPNENEDTPYQWLEKKGNTFRTYKNSLIFAMADPAGFGAFKEEVKTYLALKEISEEIEKEKESALKEKSGEVQQRMKRIKDDFSYNARKMYSILVVGNEKILLGQPTVGKESLSNWYKMELETREKLAANLHYRYIVNKFMEGKERIETKVIVEQFYKDPSFVMPETVDVIKRSIQQGIAEGAFGLAYVKGKEIDEESLKFKVNIPTTDISLGEDEILLSKEKANEILEKITEKEPSIEPEEDKEKGKAEGEKDKTVKEGPKRYRKISLRIENIPSSKIADLSRGVLVPLSREVGSFDVNVEIDIDSPEGVSEKTLKDQVKETISQIGAKITKEETE